MEELYRQYGELMIRQEILSGQINAVKKKIVDEMNKQPQEKPVTQNK